MNDILNQTADKRVIRLIEKYWNDGLQWLPQVSANVLPTLISANNAIIEENLQKIESPASTESSYQEIFRWDEVLRCTIFNIALNVSGDVTSYLDILRTFANSKSEPDLVYNVIIDTLDKLRLETIQEDSALPTRNPMKLVSANPGLATDIA